MLSPLPRRRVLRGIAALGVGLWTPFGSARAQADNIRCVVQESGAVANWPLVVAAVFTDAFDACNSKIDALRKRTGYFRQIKYSSSDEARIPFGEAMIDLFVADESVWLRGQIIGNDGDGWPDSPAQRDARYFAQYRGVLEQDIEQHGHTTIDIPRQDNQRNELLQGFLGGLANQPQVDRQGPPAGNVAQLAGLLAGCLRADKTGTTDPTRATLLTYLKARLGVESLASLQTDKVTVRSTNI